MEVEIENIDPEQTVIAGLAELSRKTGLIVRAVEPVTVERLFAEIEKYDAHERAETFECLRSRQLFQAEEVRGSSGVDSPLRHHQKQAKCDMQ